MRRSIAFGLAFFCLGLGIAALNLQATPPSNDQCSGAEIISMAGPFPWLSSITTNMHEATTTNDPPPPTECFGGVITKSVWYEFTPPEDGLYTVSLKFTATTMQDTMMGIYTSPAGCEGPFVQYACNDDVGALQSAITTNFTAGVHYYVVVWHTLTQPLLENERSLQVKITKVLPALNDVCNAAEVIPSIATPAGFPYWTAATNAHLATTNNDPADVRCALLAPNLHPQRSVWYKFRPAIGGTYIIATCTNNTATTVYNTMLNVYQNTGGCNGTFTRLRCSSGFCDTSAAVIMQLAAGTDYYIVVWDLIEGNDVSPSPDETDVQLFVGLQGPPDVVTVGHSGLAPTAVTLLGTADAKGRPTQAWFQFGTTTNYGETTLTASFDEIVPMSFEKAVVGRAPGTTIYYRAVAQNSLGMSFGEGKSVVLPFPQPDITFWGMQTNGFRIQFTGSESYTHEVQVSEDLKTWTRLGDATPLEFDQFEFVDPAAPNRPQRFYRIKL